MKTIILMGYTGVGKNTVLNIINKISDYKPSVSYTTRPKRDCETDGVEYNFITDEQFERIEFPISPRYYEVYNGEIWKYGTNPNISSGDVIILDFEGCKSLCNYLGRENCTVVKINTHQDIIRERLEERGDEPDEIERRIKDDIKAFKGSEEFADYIIDNNKDYTDLCNEVKEFLDKEEL